MSPRAGKTLTYLRKNWEVFCEKNVSHFKPSEASSTGFMSLESQNSRIPKLFLDPRNLVSQKYCDPRMVTPWCHPGVTMVGPKRKRERFPGPNLGEREKGKRSNPNFCPDLTGQCHQAAHAWTRQNDFPVGGPGGLTPQPPICGSSVTSGDKIGEVRFPVCRDKQLSAPRDNIPAPATTVFPSTPCHK